MSYAYGEIVEVVNRRVDEKFNEVMPRLMQLNNLCFELFAIEQRLVELNKEIYPYIYDTVNDKFTLIEDGKV